MIENNFFMTLDVVSEGLTENAHAQKRITDGRFGLKRDGLQLSGHNMIGEHIVHVIRKE